jgi:hypothetical protein
MVWQDAEKPAISGKFSASCNRRDSAMGPAWIFFLVGAGEEVAVPHSSVHRILHRGDPDFCAQAAEALDLNDFLGLSGDPSYPGVVVLLASGQSWLAGDAAIQRPGEKVSYLALRPELFASARPWCRGVLTGKGHWAFVVEESAVA